MAIVRRLPHLALCALLCSVACAPLAAQHRRDPLNDAEIEQVREAADNPQERLKLYTAFANQRLSAFEQLRNENRPVPDRAERLHNLMEDFVSLVDELTDNVDMYADRHNDIRKPLRLVIAADDDWKRRVQALQAASEAMKKDPRQAEVEHEYEFQLQSAAEAVNGAADSLRQTLQELEQECREKKCTKPVPA